MSKIKISYIPGICDADKHISKHPYNENFFTMNAPTWRYSLILQLIFFISCTGGEIMVDKELPFVQTVSGPVHPDSLGMTLIHEHVFLDWRPADETKPQDWNNDEAFGVIMPYLIKMKREGVKTFLECTPQYLGRNPGLLKKLSDDSGLQIVTNTGFYGYRNNVFIPRAMHNFSAEQMADIWIEEFEEGIDGTGIKPGFIKISVEPDSSLSRFHEQIVRAAVITHAETGLTIVSHTGIDTTAALQVSILENEGISPEAFVWTHAQNGTAEGHVRLAKKEAWVSLDGLGWVRPQDSDSTALYNYIDFLINLKDHNLLHRVLISHDSGWYEHGQEFEYKEYTDIFDLLIPVLMRNGFTQEDIDRMLVTNPKEAYSIRKRLL